MHLGYILLPGVIPPGYTSAQILYMGGTVGAERILLPQDWVCNFHGQNYFGLFYPCVATISYTMGKVTLSC